MSRTFHNAAKFGMGPNAVKEKGGGSHMEGGGDGGKAGNEIPGPLEEGGIAPNAGETKKKLTTKHGS